MIDDAAIGLDQLRISVETMPVHVPAVARALPGPLFLPVFASLIPQMIVPYADATAVMLANLDRAHAWPAAASAGASRGHARTEIGMVGQHRAGSPVTPYTAYQRHRRRAR